MATSLLDQKASLEATLEKGVKDYVTREALESALAEVNRKLAKKNERTAIIDGVTVKIGDPVYQYSAQDQYDDQTVTLSITKRIVSAISIDGKEIGYGDASYRGRTSTYPISGYHPSVEAAIAAYKVSQQKQLDSVRYSIAEMQKREARFVKNLATKPTIKRMNFSEHDES